MTYCHYLNTKNQTKRINPIINKIKQESDKIQQIQLFNKISSNCIPMGYSIEMTKYLMFLLNRQKTGSEKTYNQIIKYNDQQLESDHQFIQWLFPLLSSSHYAQGCPIINISELQKALEQEHYILPKIKLSYQLILHHWGFNVIESDQLIKNSINNPFTKTNNYFLIEPRVNFFEKKIKLLNGHNGLRLTRVLQSLIYHGLINLAYYTLTKILEYKYFLQPTYHLTGVTLWEYKLKKAHQSYLKIKRKYLV